MFMRKQFIWEIVEMLLLLIEDSLLRACYIRRRHHCGSNEDRDYYGMPCDDKRIGSMQLYGLRRILLTTRRRFFEDLQKKRKNFVWREKCMGECQEIKDLLTTTSIPKFPDLDQKFLVCTDASKEGLGGVLMQYG
jgi:hypothetical protein